MQQSQGKNSKSANTQSSQLEYSQPSGVSWMGGLNLSKSTNQAESEGNNDENSLNYTNNSQISKFLTKSQGQYGNLQLEDIEERTESDNNNSMTAPNPNKSFSKTHYLPLSKYLGKFVDKIDKDVDDLWNQIDNHSVNSLTKSQAQMFVTTIS